MSFRIQILHLHEKHTSAKSLSVFVKFEYSHKCFLRHFNRAERTHTLFTLFLFFEKFLLSGDVTTVAFCKNILTEGSYSFTGDNFTADGCLNRNLKELSRNVVLELFCNLPCSAVGFIGMNDEGKSINYLSVEKNIELYQL